MTRWRNADAVFIAEMNKRRLEIWEGSIAALRSLIPKAVAALDESLTSGSSATKLKAARLILSTAGIEPGQIRPAGSPTTPDAVEAEWAEKRRLDEVGEKVQAEADQLLSLIGRW